MKKTILLAAVCSVASFLIGSAERVNGAGEDEKPIVANRQPPVGRYQMVTAGNSIRIFDTMSGRYVEQHVAGADWKWVEIDPMATKITQDEFSKQVEQHEQQQGQVEKLRRIQKPVNAPVP